MVSVIHTFVCKCCVAVRWNFVSNGLHGLYRNLLILSDLNTNHLNRDNTHYHMTLKFSLKYKKHISKLLIFSTIININHNMQCVNDRFREDHGFESSSRGYIFSWNPAFIRIYSTCIQSGVKH